MESQGVLKAKIIFKRKNIVGILTLLISKLITKLK